MNEEFAIVQVNLGPYASRLYKFDMYHEEEHRLDSKNGLRFIHFNNSMIDRKTPKSMFRRWQNRTVAALALSPQGVRKAAVEFLALPPDTIMTIPMVVGVALVSQDDNYCKAKGRDESVKQMAEVDLQVTRMNVSKTHIYLSLDSYKGVELTVRLNKKSGYSTVVGQLNARHPDAV